MKRNNTVGNIALRHGILFVLGVVLSFITAGVTIYCNDTVAAAVDSVMSSSGEDKLYTYVIIIAIMAVVMLIATFLQNVIS